MSGENKAELEAKVDGEMPEIQDEQPAKVTVKETEADEDSKQYKALLNKEREARKKAEKATADYAFKLREKARKKDEDYLDEFGDELEEKKEKMMTAGEMRAILAEERELTRKEFSIGEARKIAGMFSSSETEKELILEVYNNRTFPSNLSVEEKIEECHLIANKKKIYGENRELKRALKGKSAVMSSGANAHHDTEDSKKPKMSSADSSELARVGFKWNSTANRFEKKLSNGDILIKNNKSSQAQLIKV